MTFKTSFCALSKLAEQAKMHLIYINLKVMPRDGHITVI